MARQRSFPTRRGSIPATCSRSNIAPTRRGSPNCCQLRSRLADEDPGAVALIWADWQSCSSSREELLDPVRSQYKEAFVVVRCSFEGQTYSRCVYIWVDKDFAIARGMHQGYPKKLGQMWQTRPHAFPHASPVIGPGGMFGATLAAGDRRLADVVLTLREESEHNGFVNGHKMAHHRVYPNMAGGGDAYSELIASGGSEFAGGQSWVGDVDLNLYDSPTEELSRLTSTRLSAAITARSVSSGTAARRLSGWFSSPCSTGSVLHWSDGQPDDHC